jgi:uncharacterized protein (DUF849 family)
MRRPTPPPRTAAVKEQNSNATIVTITGSGAQQEEEKKKAVKKVKFNPEVSTNSSTASSCSSVSGDDCTENMEKNAIKLLEESILNFNPMQQKQEELKKRQQDKMKKVMQEEEESASAGKGKRIEDCVSYYEPYI